MSLWPRSSMLTQNPYFRTKKCSRVHSDREEIAHSMPWCHWCLRERHGVWGMQTCLCTSWEPGFQKQSAPQNPRQSHCSSGGSGWILGSEWSLVVSTHVSSAFRSGTSRHQAENSMIVFSVHRYVVRHWISFLWLQLQMTTTLVT